jgi:hypothetical protein
LIRIDFFGGNFGLFPVESSSVIKDRRLRKSDNGVAGPEMYDYCERSGLLFAFGYATKNVLKQWVSELELVDNARLLWWMTVRREIQTFHVFEDYNAKSWPHARRIVTKVEITNTGGTNIRYVVTNMSGNPGGIYRGFYVQRRPTFPNDRSVN